MFEYNHGSVLWERFFMGTDNSTAAAIVAMTGMIAYVVFVVLATDVAQKKQSMETSPAKPNKHQGRSHTRSPHESDIVSPLNDFDYRTVNPIDYRPFKTMPHVSMGGSHLL
ncbi:hypothetical protein N7471_003362 [Penicillium samsonianum]|uniref:uncharacterized protein n=1 Tax=Penicillium samsonianum TaxID=1882272 RepID=UPI0025474FF0|nr:uncharacterized protein N7471_003362 [Penicillium samsonianum]KAJ6143909.1 hypothetical protein N7471_003362 [Penicillium samsonianum]